LVYTAVEALRQRRTTRDTALAWSTTAGGTSRNAAISRRVNTTRDDESLDEGTPNDVDGDGEQFESMGGLTGEFSLQSIDDDDQSDSGDEADPLQPSSLEFSA
jgi:hypothetical protein